MKIDNREFNIKYVDPSLVITDLSIVRDGSSPATAYENIPALENNTCYLIRRCDATANLYQGTSAVVNVMFLGMPKADDFYYQFMPDEVKTAWGSDTNDKAYLSVNRTSVTNPDNSGQQDSLTTTGSNHLVLSACKYFVMHNIFLHRTAACATYTSTGSGHMISFSNHNTHRIIKFTNCHIGYNKVIIDQNYANITSSFTPDFNGRCFDYVRFGDTGTVIVDNCEIDLAVRQSSSTHYISGAFIAYGSVYNFITTNNKINMLGNIQKGNINYTYWGCSVFGVKNFSFNSVISNVIATNLEVNWCCVDGRLPAGRVLDFEAYSDSNVYSNKISIKNIKNNLLVFKDFVPTTANRFQLMFMKANTGFDIENIDADFTKYNFQFTSSNDFFINIDNVKAISSGNFIRSMKNIKVLFNYDDENVFNNGGGGIKFTGYKNQTGINLSTEEDANRYNYSTYYPMILKNFNIKSSGNTLYVSNANILSGKVYGKILASLGSYIELDDFTSLSDDVGINLGESYSAYVRIHNFNIIDTGTYVNQIINYYNSKTIIIDKVNGQLPINKTYVTSTNNTTNQTCYALFNNYDNGKFYVKNLSIYAESSSIIRNGSASNNTLKLVNNYYNANRTPLELGEGPINGFIRNVVAGTYDFVCYFAVKGNNLDNLKCNFRVDIESNKLELVSPNDVTSNLGSKNIYSSASGYIVEDTSTWSDENVTAYKLVIPNVKIGSDKTNIKISYCYYDTTGYVYVDPAFEFITK